ncbi:MAG: hypothetical protein Q8Q09_16010 [Deltaproteobacteria bacterium]|nr:hypothetical protein [Deltaproteobacteria bacterium]
MAKCIRVGVMVWALCAVACTRPVGPATQSARPNTAIADVREARDAGEVREDGVSGDAWSVRCGDVAGAWSESVGGLRGRVITSGSRADGSALRVTLELHNESVAERVTLRWAGRPEVGFVVPDLEDAQGASVPEPAWRLPGNEFGVNGVRHIAPGQTVALDFAGNLFERGGLGRIVRIGAFWAREMPLGGPQRYLRLRVPQAVGTTAGRAWTGPLVLPRVCVD